MATHVRVGTHGNSFGLGKAHDRVVEGCHIEMCGWPSTHMDGCLPHAWEAFPCVREASCMPAGRHLAVVVVRTHHATSSRAQGPREQRLVRNGEDRY